MTLMAIVVMPSQRLSGSPLGSAAALALSIAITRLFAYLRLRIEGWTTGGLTAEIRPCDTGTCISAQDALDQDQDDEAKASLLHIQYASESIDKN